ncbi:MAG: PQQ-like beta-propeller repeat protein, partial [Myxococcales bacterium]|nr:PQQ-like beta-propeller repeat protein [Myxococcales bacterium]
INAIDVHTGDVAWRVSEAGRFSAPPTFVRDRVIAVSGDPRSSRAQVLGIDLYSGRTEWSRTLEAPPTARPLAHGKRITVPVGHGRRTTLITLQAEDGSVVWTAPDPGLGIGGEALAIDRALIVNAPNGTVTALDEDSGAQRWQRKLSDPVADDVPRRLEPVLRGGALFVPASKVHVLRPKDGSSNGDALPCDLVPDLIRVDERGWVYIAEESGHLEAYAPVAQLRLVKG